MNSVEPSTGSTCDPYELSYQASSLDKTGRIMSKEKKRSIREKEGYCLTCPGTPSKLFEIKKSRLNPLWVQKKPQTIEGQSLNGWCVKCNPALNKTPSRRDLNVSRKHSVAGLDVLSRGSDHSGRSVRSEVSSRSGRSDQSLRSGASTASVASLVSPTRSVISIEVQPVSGRSVARTASESRLASGSRVPQTRQHSFNAASRMVPNRELIGSSSVRSFGSPHGGIPKNVLHSGIHGRQLSIVSQSSDSEVSNRSMDVMMERQSSHRTVTSSRPNRLNAYDREVSLRSMGSLGSSHSQQEFLRDGHASQDIMSAPQSNQRSLMVEGHSSFRSFDSSESLSGQRNLRSLDPSILYEKGSSFPNATRRSFIRTDSMEGSDHGFGKTWDEAPAHIRKSLDHSFTSELTELPSASDDSCIQTSDIIVNQSASRHRAPRNPSFRHSQHESHPRHLSCRTNSSRSIASFESDGELFQQMPPVTTDDAIAIVRDVKNLLSDIMNVQDPELTIDILIDSMTSHLNVQEIQCLCISHIADLFGDMSADCTHLFAVNGHQCILLAMKNFPSSLPVQETSLEALASLVLRESTRIPLIREGLCSLIDNALHRFLAEERMVISAVQTLRALSCEREGALIMDDLHISQKVIEVMHCNMMSVSIQRDGCSLLSNLAVDVDNQRVSQVDSSTLLVIEAAMREHQLDSTIQASACFALKNLSFEKNNLRTISKRPPLIELLMNAQESANANADAMLLIERIQVCLAEDQSLEEQVCESLHPLVEARRGQPEIVNDVIDTLENYEWSERITATCIDILCALTRESELYKKKLSEENQIRRLEFCANSSLYSDSLRQQSHKLIESLRGVYNTVSPR